MALKTSLVSYWKLDEASGNALDAHGSNTLTDNNTVGSAAGILGNARDFEESSNQYFSITDNADFANGDIALAFTCWVKLESKGASCGIICKDDGGDPEYLLYYDQGGDRFAWLVYSASGGGGSHQVSANTLGSPSLGVWYFIVVWHDPVNDLICIQVNDGGVDSTAHSAGVYDFSGTFKLGRSDRFNLKHDGLIDEVAFWHRVPTSGELTSIYNGGAGLPYASWDVSGNRRRRVLLSLGAA